MCSPSTVVPLIVHCEAARVRDSLDGVHDLVKRRTGIDLRRRPARSSGSTVTSTTATTRP
jgi:hypothetical protein